MKDAHAQQHSESFSQPLNNAQSLTWLHIPAYAELKFSIINSVDFFKF